MLPNHKHVGLFIDGANLYASTQAIRKKLNYLNLQKWLDNNYPRWFINFYTAVKPDETGFDNLKKTLDWMQYNKIRTVTKEARTIAKSDGSALIKGNMDIEITVDALVAARYLDSYMLFTGDGDFVYLIKELHRLGKHVTVVSSLNVLSTADKPMPMFSDSANVVADILRREADAFINLNLKEDISKEWLE